MWISVWSLMGAEAVILILWAIYKYLREMKFRNAMAARMKSEKMGSNNQEDEVDETDFKKEIMKVDEKKPASAVSTSDADSLKESEKLKFRGYKSDFFGYFAFGSVVITTLLFFVFLGVLVGDYCKSFVCYLILYSFTNQFHKLDGTVTGVALQVFLSSDLSSKIFAAVWHISAAWFCVIMFTRKTIRNYFRIESYPHKCPYVQVERKQEELIFLDDGSKWLAKLRSIEQRVYKHFG